MLAHDGSNLAATLQTIIEASHGDSLNAAILAPDVEPGSAEFGLFVDEVVRVTGTAEAVLPVLPGTILVLGGAVLGAWIGVQTGIARAMSPGVGLVKEGDLRRELERLYAERGHDDPAVAARFLEDVRAHSALLLDRGGRHYGFIHLTFQEYLAAVALAQRAQQGAGAVADALAAHVGEAPWHEVSLLTVGYLAIVQQWESVASEVVEELPFKAFAQLNRECPIPERLLDDHLKHMPGRRGRHLDPWRERHRQHEGGVGLDGAEQRPAVAAGDVVDAAVVAGAVVEPDPARQVRHRLRPRPIRIILMPGHHAAVMRRFAKQLIVPEPDRPPQ